jgi:DNA-binding NarL/FixJ family response regulator
VQRVLIVDNGFLLCAGIQKLLARHPGLNVLSSSPKNQAELIQKIRCARPDVVVLDGLTHPFDVANFTLFSADAELRVVVVNANDNQVRIYGKREVLITRAVDLINILRGD